MAMFNQTNKMDPIELFKWFQERKANASTPEGRKSNALGSKPGDAGTGELSPVEDYFASLWEKTQQSVEATRKELAPTMEEAAKRSAEQAATLRSKMGITDSDFSVGAKITEMQKRKQNISMLKEPEPYEAEDEGEASLSGLMSKPFSDTEKAGRMFGSEGSTKEFASRFVDLMGVAEGTEDHTASEGQFTYAYGILPATAQKLRVNPADFETRKDFATAVYGKMYDNAKASYPDVFEGMNLRDRESVMSMYINLGRLTTEIVDALSGREKDIPAAADSLKSVIHYRVAEGENKGRTYASKGLSKRRASEFNTLMDGRDGFSPVARVSVEGSKAEPVFVWKDVDGNVIKRYTSSRPLSPDNNMKELEV